MTTNTPRRRTAAGQLPWRKDPVVLARLPEVERLHLAGKPNTVIARALAVSEGTIRKDIERLQGIWLERVSDEVAVMRAQAVAELDDVRRRAVAAAEFDEACERAVLFGVPFAGDDGVQHLVKTDDKGSAKFSGNKAAALTVASNATMNRAKILGIVVEKQELSGDTNFLEALRAFGAGSSGDGRS